MWISLCDYDLKRIDLFSKACVVFEGYAFRVISSLSTLFSFISLEIFITWCNPSRDKVIDFTKHPLEFLSCTYIITWLLLLFNWTFILTVISVIVVIFNLNSGIKISFPNPILIHVLSSYTCVCLISFLSST